MKDLQLVNIGGTGQWEPNVTVNDADAVTGFETAILVSLFSNARADESEISDPIRRGGWWGNVLNPQGYELGAKSWMLEREKITNANTATLKRYVERALNWMLAQRVLKIYAVSVRPDIKRQRYLVAILLTGRDGKEYRYAYDWSLTDASKITKNI